ncbi:MAG: M36 family metallopeptidase, partial [Bacteroidota bacterium]
ALPLSLGVTTVKNDASQSITYAATDWAQEPVKLGLNYFVDEEGKLLLSWQIEWYTQSADHRWMAYVDALTGHVLEARDLVIRCEFGHEGHEHSDQLCYDTRGRDAFLATKQAAIENMMLGGSYKVFPMPVESPNHGDQALVDNVENALASPYGWHDVDGENGFEFTITRGNNVHAYLDLDNSGSSAGDEPDGGDDLIFDFDYIPGAEPIEYGDAAVTNLFYWCNLMHDITYNYGFDEPSGNFQQNNYGNGGASGDYIRAEAQDGGGTNNANFSSGGDGSNARIQMYLWTGGGGADPNLFTVDEPSSIAGTYEAAAAGFGPGFGDPVVGELVVVDDESGTPTLGCNPIANDVAGKIAVIDRGDCPFVDKVANAEAAGAIAVVVCNNVAGGVIAMGGDGGGIGIPSLMITQADCETIKTVLDTEAVQVTLESSIVSNFLDGDFDSGIVCHEYGHGVSIRLTGGPNTGGCLGSATQMGEGWSDYLGLWLTMEEGDTGEDIRGIGTFAIGQSTLGTGIRPAPYSRDLGINDFTYAATNNAGISQPHGIGFVWCTMLWDMTWALIDIYGFDTDFYNGEGGNNVALQLVMEGMKLQPCNPGFVDGRDAILAADMALYGGEHQCLLWEVFAARGLGYSADQGEIGNRFDQVEAFDIAPSCLVPTVAPSAQFDVSALESCSGLFFFTDSSVDVPQSWEWDFGDSSTSNEQNPSHVYTEEGTYEVVLTVSNTIGTDQASLTVVVDFPDAPTVDDVDAVCDGTSATLSASGAGVINWYENGTLVFTGETFTTPVLNGNTVYSVENEIQSPSDFGGPEDNTFGGGGIFNVDYMRGIIIDVTQPMEIVSCWVDADGPGNRVVELFDETGAVVDSKVVFIEDGQSTIDLGLVAPAPGTYILGGTEMSLFRNNTGPIFPYPLGGIASIVGTNATSGNNFYYFFYNLEVRAASCFSDQVEVLVETLDAPEAFFEFTQAGAEFNFTDLSTDAVSWFWEFGDGNFTDEQNPTYFYAADGVYPVTLTVSNGTCENTYSLTVEIVNVAVTEIEGLEAFRLFPNLGTGTFQLEADLNETRTLSVRVFNTLGQMVYEVPAQQTASLREEIRLQGLGSGTYFVQLQVDGQQVTERYVLMD